VEVSVFIVRAICRLIPPVNGNNKEVRDDCSRLKSELRRATDKAKKEYLESICDEIMEFNSTCRYGVM
jgi:hypothetical protein